MTVTTRTQTEMRLTFENLRDMCPEIPDNAENIRIYMRVPGGGDWSCTDLDVGDDDPLFVTWTVTEEKVEK